MHQHQQQHKKFRAPLPVIIYAYLAFIITAVMVFWSLFSPTTFFQAFIGELSAPGLQFSWSMRYLAILIFMLPGIISRNPRLLVVAIIARLLIDIPDVISMCVYNTPPLNGGSMLALPIALIVLGATCIAIMRHRMLKLMAHKHQHAGKHEPEKK